MTSITRINVFRSRGEWCYSAWIEEEYSHSDSLEIDNSATTDEAIAEAKELCPSAVIAKVPDVA